MIKLEPVQTRKISLPESPQEEYYLGVPIHFQRLSNWCWAACVEMTYKYRHPNQPLEQCTVANAALQRGDCCLSGGANTACNSLLFMPQIVGLCQTFVNPFAHSVPAVLAWPALTYMISNERAPAIAQLVWNNGFAHVVVIMGWRVTPGFPPDYQVFVQDPDGGNKLVTYDALVNAYYLGRWAETIRGL